MKNKCTHCGVRKVIFKSKYNYEGRLLFINLCDTCLKKSITALLDLVDYRYYKSHLEKFSGTTL